MKYSAPAPVINHSDCDRDTLRDRIVEREVKKAGFKAKIRAFCCHCIYDPYQDGTWLKQVENCTSWHCPLYSVRPKPSGKAVELSK